MSAFLPRLVSIQVLRGFAALAVALLHLEPDWRLRGFVPEDWTRPFPFEAGVNVFFVISGFVMVYASHALFGRKGAARLFLARRIARVVPLYWLTTAIVLVVLAIRPDMMRSAVATPALAVASFLFVPWPRPDGIPQPVYSLGWTLNFEMFFYLVFGAALGLGLARRATVAAVAALLLVLVAVGQAAPLLPQPFGFWTSPIQLEFVFGMALGLARSEGVTLPGAARAALLGAGLLLFWLVGPDPGAMASLVKSLAATCLVAACGLASARPEEPQADRPALSRLSRLGETLGDASYAIYLLHPFAIRGSLRLIDALALGPALGRVGLTAAALTATIALSVLSYRLIERPLTRLVRKWTEPAASRAVAPEAG